MRMIPLSVCGHRSVWSRWWCRRCRNKCPCCTARGTQTLCRGEKKMEIKVWILTGWRWRWDSYWVKMVMKVKERSICRMFSTRPVVDVSFWKDVWTALVNCWSSRASLSAGCSSSCETTRRLHFSRLWVRPVGGAGGPAVQVWPLRWARRWTLWTAGQPKHSAGRRVDQSFPPRECCPCTTESWLTGGGEELKITAAAFSAPQKSHQNTKIINPEIITQK